MSIALVTGASSGLGVTFARKLAQAGHNLTLVARRLDRLESVAATLSKDFGVRTETLAADLATDAGIDTVVRYIESASGLEVLVNNAGFGTKGMFHQADVAGQDQMNRVHVMATMHLTHAALRRMVAQRSGAVINVSSVAAFTIGAGSVCYGATKSWINSFTKGLDAELRAVNSPVKVQALCPGFTITEFHDTLGMDRALVPRFLWLSADFVVDTSLQALKGDRVIVIPSWKYKLPVMIMKHLPESLQRRMAHATGRRMKRLEGSQ
jgi:short-subunit dehydrogenase